MKQEDIVRRLELGQADIECNKEKMLAILTAQDTNIIQVALIVKHLLDICDHYIATCDGMELYSPDLMKMHDIYHDSIQHLVTVGNSLLDFVEDSIDVEVNGTSSEVGTYRAMIEQSEFNSNLHHGEVKEIYSQLRNKI